MRKNQEITLSAEVEDKLIAIGDIHGLTQWQKVVEAHPTANHYVFLGDYCDPYGTTIQDETVVDNLINILAFKHKYPERVVLLLGNHDMHYLIPSLPKGSRYNLSLAMMLHDLFENNQTSFQTAFACNRLLFTHAGITSSWLQVFRGKSEPLGTDESIQGDLSAQSLARQLNERTDDPVMMQCSFLRGGFSNYGGPFWADIEEFTEDELLPGQVQIVGHNRVSSIEVKGASIATTGYIIFCDSLYRDHFLVVEHPTSEEPDIYEDHLKK